MRRSVGVRARVLVAGVGAVLLLTGTGAATAATASTGTVPGGDTAAAVQAVLDRVLGPGNAVVVVSDTIRTSSGTTSTQAFGSGVPQSVVAATTGTSALLVQQDAVSSTSSTVATPAGGLVRQSVSVAVDRAHLGGRSVAAIRALVVSSSGIVAARGDRLSVVVTRFARPAPAPAPAPAPTPLTLLLPYAPQLIWVLGAVLALAVLAGAVRGRRRPA
ncbi:flagellar M-ring protein FliF C-terminal domain-containing protein [Amnibacterium kyonggiense]|uniref:Flagellar M-ring protein n=1 Tax=Amnibacterium kyonggiense TaxID=595671 RepID=A0A4R7FTC7_9MICO|nr:flagellar M-ring protein FliF C-terminal domain-containing protein [Amnibacterium kyonggiense]TDS81048.1 flagellar M-ring protein [Amnibacterium kyonggiense]